MNSSYKYYENKYNTTKPIRGRSVEVRPIGRRNRDWETITSKNVDGGISYSAKLHSTECVEYLPNGDLVIRCGQWVTPITAEFIWTHSPFKCVKRYKKLWIHNKDEFLPINGELRLKYLGGDNGWIPAEEIIIKQQVVDKQLAKAVRAPLMPFLNFGEAFLKMSDGWIMHETRIQAGVKTNAYGGYNHDRLNNIKDEAMYDHLATCDESEYLYALSYFLQDSYTMEEKRVAKTAIVEVMAGTSNSWTRKCEYLDGKYSQTLLRKRIFSIAKKARDMYKIIDVKPSGKTVGNTL
jgi:hypothetical protein